MDVPKELKAEVLAELYNNSQPLGMGFLHFTPAPMSVDQADELLIHVDHNGDVYFDYLQGRVMKINFRSDTDEVETWLYNRDNGDNAAERCLETVLDRHK